MDAIWKAVAGMEELARATQRLVHPRAADPATRAAHGRFIALAFAAPMLAPMIALTDPAADAVSMLVFTTVALALCWGAALIAMTTGRLALAGAWLALAFSALVAFAAVQSGIPASPLLLLLLAVPTEAWFVGRKGAPTRLAGLGAAAAAAAALSAVPASGAALTAAHWLAPAAWALTVSLRWRADDSGAADKPSDWETVVDGALVRFGAGGGVKAITRGAGPMLGLEPVLLGEKGLFDRIHVADRVDYLRALAAVRGDGGRERVALRVRAPAAAPGDGSGYLDLTLDLACGEDDVVGWLRQETAPARRAAPSPAIADTNALEIAKSRFLAAVSHELRTPLNAIIGFSDMMLHGLFGPFADPRQHEYVALISESGGHLLNVVNAILDVSKIEAGTYAIRPEPFAFAEAVDMSRSMLTRQAGVKGIVVENAVDDDPEIVADRRAVQQILINLLSNAVKFTPDGGKVTVAAARRPGIFEFSVSDTGIGIAEADLARLGRPFTQIENDLTRNYDGAGLGLSLVKGLVELHHGSMSIESAPGEGTTVRIGLPDDGSAASTQTERQQDIRHEALRRYG